MSIHSLQQTFSDIVPLLEQYTRADRFMREDNLLHERNEPIRRIVESLVARILLPGSTMRGNEQIASFLHKTNEGKRGLILAEHYSNFDLPCLLYLMEQGSSAGRMLSEKIVSIAGIKLREENRILAMLTEGYDHLVIYPSRSLATITDAHCLARETKRSRALNRAAMKYLEELRNAGKVILVFPAGTRYRPGRPETKRGVREVYSFIKHAEVLLLISINGNCLRVAERSTDMTEDAVHPDVVLLEARTVDDCALFREKALDWHRTHNVAAPSEDKKQIVVDYVMHLLEEMHEHNERERLS